MPNRTIHRTIHRTDCRPPSAATTAFAESNMRSRKATVGKGKIKQPKKLAFKLLSLRELLDLSQEEMVKHVQPGVEDARRARASLTEFEQGRRAPSLLEILHYAKAVRELTPYKAFSAEDLMDDAKPLPWLIR